MSIHVEWDNPAQTVLRYDYNGKWTWNELFEAVDLGYVMIDSVPHKVAVIIDMTRSEGIPPGALSHARTIQQRAHPRICMNVAVNAGGMLTKLTQTFLGLYNALMKSTAVYFATSVEEARQLITEKMSHNSPEV